MSTILDLLIEEGIATTRSWQVDRGREAPLDVDLRLQGGDFGILWVSPQDRSDHGEALPEPLENGRLLILPGADAHAAARILLLDHESYRYTSEREHVQGGAPSAGDAEARLRQDIRDFLTLARGQGGL